MRSGFTVIGVGAALAALTVGCMFAPSLGDGRLRCGSGGSCPPGQSCGDDGICHQGLDTSAGDPPLDGGTCSPLHCYVGWCGPVDDGCGKTLDCGSCNPGNGAPDMAGGAAVDMAGCTPTRQCVAGATCGNFDDGCGGTLRCGACADPRNCSHDRPFSCTCTPTTCAAVNASCGVYPSGCGGVLLDCFAGADMGCADGVCGGGGPYTCGSTYSCNPLKTCPANACGVIPNGCNGVLHCGAGCPAGQVCGGGGRPNVCG